MDSDDVERLAQGLGYFVRSMANGEPIPINDETVAMFLSLMAYSYRQHWAVSFYTDDGDLPPDHFLVSPPHQRAPEPAVQDCLPEKQKLPDDTMHLLVAASAENARQLADLAKQQLEELAGEDRVGVREVVVDNRLNTKQVFRDN